MLRYYPIILLIIMLVSCDRNSDSEDVQVDFLINNEELQSLGYDYNMDDLSLYKNDPDKVFFTSVGKTLIFKDVSPLDNPEKRRWYLNDEELEGQDEDRAAYQYAYKFETPGIYRISLKINDKETVTKLIKVMEPATYAKTFRPSKYNKGNRKEYLEGLGDFEVFDFTISNNEPGTWEPIVFEDISITEVDITKRLWDFGDGTIIPTKGTKVKYSYANEGVYEVKMCLNLTNNCKRKRIVVAGTSYQSAQTAVAENIEKPETSPPTNGSTNNKVAQNKTRSNTNSVSKPKSTFTRSNKSTENKTAEDRPIVRAEIPTSEDIEQPIVENPPIQLRNVEFEIPTKVQAGTPIRIKDLSYPEKAIQARNWYIDGEKQYFYQRSVDYIFDMPGTYEIKMCINMKSENCITKKINVYQNQVVAIDEVDIDDAEEIDRDFNVDDFIPDNEKKRKVTYIPIVSGPNVGFLCHSYGKAGVKAKYRCTNDMEYHYGNAIVNITPKEDIELQNAEIYGSTDGYMDVLLLNDKFEEQGKIKNVQVLPGYSTIEFGDLSLTLEKGKKYSLLLKPLPRKNKKIGLENAAACTVPLYANEDMEIEYVGGVKVIYDLKYCK